MKLEEIITKNLVLDLEDIKGDRELLREIQTQLNFLNLYPSGRWIDGEYGSRTEKALIKFCNLTYLNTMQTGKFGTTFAEKLLQTHPAIFSLEKAKDRENVFREFYRQETNYDAYKLAFLDKGIDNSPYQKEISNYPSYLKEKPDGQEVLSLGAKATAFTAQKTALFKPYPQRGELPDIDSRALEFLHKDITEACICIGSFVDGKLRSRWLGRNALNNVQFWSTTKFIAILNLICEFNTKFPHYDIDETAIASNSYSNAYGFYDLASETISYDSKIASSNSIAHVFKRFETYRGLENWVKAITGNHNLKFSGRYGERPFIESPQLIHRQNKKVLLTAAPITELGENILSAYDLTRLISMLGWHYHIPPSSRLPGAQWYSLESLVQAMGKDTARYGEVAIAKLGLQTAIRSPVIISKMGFGRSRSRNITEIAYVALIQFVDRHLNSQDQPSILRVLAMTLRGAKALNDPDREATELDARIASEVTEILRQIVTEELL